MPGTKDYSHIFNVTNYSECIAAIAEKREIFGRSPYTEDNNSLINIYK